MSKELKADMQGERCCGVRERKWSGEGERGRERKRDLLERECEVEGERVSLLPIQAC